MSFPQIDFVPKLVMYFHDYEIQMDIGGMQCHAHEVI